MLVWLFDSFIRITGGFSATYGFTGRRLKRRFSLNLSLFWCCEMRGIFFAVLVSGLLGVSVKADSTINSLRDAAVRLEGDVQCKKWDCDCAYKHQRGCCCAAADLTEAEDEIFVRMMDFWTRLNQLGYDVLQVTGDKKVAFTASMSSRTDCLGPFTRTKPITYDIITLNHGRGYNPALGVFTAPRSGLYSFSVSIYSKLRAAGERMYHKVQLVRNGEVVASTWEDNREDSEDSSSHTVLLSLRRGGQVYVELLNGRRLCGNVQGLNTFSGHLMYPHPE